MTLLTRPLLTSSISHRILKWLNGISLFGISLRIHTFPIAKSNLASNNGLREVWNFLDLHFPFGLQSSPAEFYHFANSFTLAVQDHGFFVAWYCVAGPVVTIALSC